MTIGFSLFFCQLKGEKKPEKQCIDLFFQYDPTYCICSHVIPIDAMALVFYMKVKDALKIRLDKRVTSKKTLKLDLGCLRQFIPNIQQIQQKIQQNL